MKRIGLLIMIILLSGCAQSGNPGEPVEQFLREMLDGDVDKALEAVCPMWEEQAALEINAFSGVSGRLDGVACNKSGSEGGYTLVECTGRIVLDYNGEERERSLEDITYRVKKIDSEWKLCGYK